MASCVFDPQMGTALSAIHDRVNTPWTVESLAEAAGMSRSAFAARFKELLGQTPLEYVTEWRMQKADFRRQSHQGRGQAQPEGRHVRRAHLQGAGRQPGHLPWILQLRQRLQRAEPTRHAGRLCQRMVGQLPAVRGRPKNIADWKFWQVEFYVQDSWRVAPRLTLDLGLRFYGMPPITNVATGRNASTEFVPSAYNQGLTERLYIGECVVGSSNAIVSTANGPCPSTDTTKAYDPVTGTFAISSLIGTFVPNSVANYPSGATPYPGMVIAGSSPALPQGLYTVPFLSPAGRFGFAWDVFGNGKTAIRGGIGQFLNRLSYNQIASPSSFPPVLQTLNLYYGNITNISSGAASLGAISPGSMNADFIGTPAKRIHLQRKPPGSAKSRLLHGGGGVLGVRTAPPRAAQLPLDYYPLFSQFNNGAAWVNPTTAYLQNNALTGYQGGNSGLGLLGGQYIFNPERVPHLRLQLYRHLPATVRGNLELQVFADQRAP